MQLSDFFATFNLYNLSIFILAFIIFDSIGVNIAYFLKPERYLRPVYWLWGLGLFVFSWFLLHFFIPFWPLYVWISLMTCLVLSLPLYIKQKGPVSFIKTLLKFPFPLLFILIAAKPLFFLLNAPPFYTDEMAYHFYSPAQLLLENKWPFLGLGAPSLYHMVPKMLETSFVLMFSLTKTYATARLLHFLIVFFSLYAIAIYIRKNIGILSAIIYSFLSLIMSASSFLAASTWGYIDAGTAVLANLFLITIIDAINKPQKNKIYVAALTFGLAIGTKYTSLGFIGSAIFVGAVLFLLRNHHKITTRLKRIRFKSIAYKLIIKFLFISSLIIIFGGYWYIKNYIISGNPIYPFVFGCKNSWACGSGKGFFQGWAIAMDINNYPTIKDIIFQRSNLWFLTTVLSVIIGFITGKMTNNSIVRWISIIIPFSVILELILSRNFTGFDLRYYYHWVLFIPLLLILPLGIFPKTGKIPTIAGIIMIPYLLLLAYSAGNVSLRNTKRIYEPDFVPGYIRNYAMHRITLNDWINYYTPDMSDFIRWCGQKKPMQKILLIDPDLIWNNYEVRIFMVNCSLNGETGSYIISKTRCTYGKPYVTSDPDPSVQKYHEENQKLICSAKEVIKNLYFLPDRSN